MPHVNWSGGNNQLFLCMYTGCTNVLPWAKKILAYWNQFSFRMCKIKIRSSKENFPTVPVNGWIQVWWKNPASRCVCHTDVQNMSLNNVLITSEKTVLRFRLAHSKYGLLCPKENRWMTSRSEPVTDGKLNKLLRCDWMLPLRCIQAPPPHEY